MAGWYYEKNGQQQGPVNSVVLKQLLADGKLNPSDMIWREGLSQWVKASQIKGLFPQTVADSPANKIPTTMRSAAAVSTAPPQPPPPAVRPLQYATPGSYATTTQQVKLPALTQSHQRILIAFVIVAGLMFCVNLILLAAKLILGKSPHSPPEELDWVISGFVALFLLSIAALVLWLVLVNNVHAYLRILTGGRYDISPGKALGFSVIPLFDGFWVVYMPWRASGELNRYLVTRGVAPISAGLVLAFQITSLITALFLPGLTPVLYAASMWRIQAAMKRLLTAQQA